MYLFKYNHAWGSTAKQRATFDLTLHNLRWLVESRTEVFRFHDGKFERLSVWEFPDEDPPHVIRFHSKWEVAQVE